MDIYGTGVNLAARIAALAGPGEIVVAADVHDQLIQGFDAETESLRKKPGYAQMNPAARDAWERGRVLDREREQQHGRTTNESKGDGDRGGHAPQYRRRHPGIRANPPPPERATDMARTLALRILAASIGVPTVTADVVKGV